MTKARRLVKARQAGGRPTELLLRVVRTAGEPVEIPSPHGARLWCAYAEVGEGHRDLDGPTPVRVRAVAHGAVHTHSAPHSLRSVAPIAGELLRDAIGAELVVDDRIE